MPKNGNGNGDHWPRFEHEDGDRHRHNGFNRFLWMLGLLALAAFVLFVIISISRMHPETLALVTGGVLIAGPALAIIGLLLFIILRLLSMLVNRQSSAPPQQMTIPPIIMQIPQAPQQPALPYYGGNGGDDYIPTSGGTRGWEVIGGDER